MLRRQRCCTARNACRNEEHVRRTWAAPRPMNAVNESAWSCGARSIHIITVTGARPVCGADSLTVQKRWTCVHAGSHTPSACSTSA